MSNVLTVCPPIKLAIMLKKLKLKMMVMRFFTLQDISKQAEILRNLKFTGIKGIVIPLMTGVLIQQPMGGVVVTIMTP